MKVGVLVVGHRGATASTTIAATRLCARGELAPFLLSESGAPARLPLPEPAAFAWGGWDPFAARESWAETLTRHGVLDLRRWPDLPERLACVKELEPIALARDHAVTSGETRLAGRRGAEILADLRRDIRAFREETGADHLVLLNISAPALLPPRERWPQDAGAFLEQLDAGVFESAPPYYVAAAILEGAAVADYTASATLEMPGLEDLARREGVPLAGRDGSTGQTLLKSVLAQTFVTRRLRVRGWYSTNILGNHDGLMLSDPRYCDVKKVDKTELLERILGYPVQAHLVDIRHYLPAGDEKEAWDAIDFEGLLGARGRLRLDWQCSDSLLAAPALIDLARFLGWAVAEGRSGVQPWLGVFFKYALGTPERRYLALAAELERFCREASPGRVSTPVRPLASNGALHGR
jgi:myo-inositol-1-phosphate synthase